MKTITWLALSAVLLLIGCKKDDSSKNSSCILTGNYLLEEDFIDQTFDLESCPGIVQTAYPEGIELKRAVYNPADDGMVAFIKYDYNSLNNCTLEVFDFCTGTTFELNNVDCDNLDWSRSNWLLFTQLNNVFKMRPDGSELTQLTNQNAGRRNLIWNYEGTKIALLEFSGISSALVIADENMNILERYPSLSESNIFDWAEDDRICLVKSGDSTTYGIYTFDPPNLFANEVYIPNFSQHFRSLAWANEAGVIYWTSETGISKIDIHTGEIRHLTGNVSNRQYFDLTISSDDSRLITIRNNLELVDDCELSAIQQLYYYNIDSGDQQPISLE